MSIVIQYPDYLLLLTKDGGMPAVPSGQRLGAVFTTATARDAFRQQLESEVFDAASTGADLFPKLHEMHLDGVVFNPSGPQPSITLDPSAIERLCQHLQPAGFDRLATAAFPNGAPGPIAALDALWNELFSLKEWVFVVRPGGMANPYPYVAIFQDQRCVFAFTDGERARQFCIDNHLMDPAGKNSFHMTMPLPGALEWIEEAGGRSEFEVVHFNLGGVGWFAPVANFPAIRRHLGKFAGL